MALAWISGCAIDATGPLLQTGDGVYYASDIRADSHSKFYSRITSRNLDGSGERTLTEEVGEVACIQPSPDGSFLAFTSSVVHFIPEPGMNVPGRVDTTFLKVMRPDGSGLRVLDDCLTILAGIRISRWGRIVYVTKDRRVRTVDARTGVRKDLTAPGLVNFGPTFSPNGQMIAFCSNLNLPASLLEVYVMDSAGSNVKRISFGNGYVSQPSFSPDGRLVAYIAASGLFGQQRLVTVDLEDLSQRDLFSLPESNIVGFSWNPDGGNIAVSTTPSSYSIYEQDDIYLVDVSDCSSTLLTPREGIDRDPMWNRVGDKLLFQSDRDTHSMGNLELYVMAPPGSDMTRITRDEYRPWSMTWW